MTRRVAKVTSYAGSAAAILAAVLATFQACGADPTAALALANGVLGLLLLGALCFVVLLLGEFP